MPLHPLPNVPTEHTGPITTVIHYPGGGSNHVVHEGPDARNEGIRTARDSVHEGVRGMESGGGNTSGKHFRGGYEQFAPGATGNGRVGLGGGVIHVEGKHAGSPESGRNVSVEHMGNRFNPHLHL